ncbi:MAG: AMP-binding protein [Oscillospiraceae bacterium]
MGMVEATAANSEALMEITIGDLLARMAAQYPDDNFVKYTDRDYCRTWKEFNEEAEEVARGFLNLGVKKGDHIAIWATNIPEWLLTLFATAKIGAVLVTVNTNYKVFELEYLLKQSDTKYLVMCGGTRHINYFDIINELIPELETAGGGELNVNRLPCLKYIFHTEAEEHKGIAHFRSLYGKNSPADFAAYDRRYAQLTPHDIVNMQYTSGTTGFPKGVMLTHHNIVNNGKAIGDCMKFTHNDRLCVTVPFFHCFGLVLAIMSCLTHASSMVPIDAYQPEKCMQAIQDELCTAFHGVPTMFIAILDHPEFKNYKFPRLRTGIMAGSPCPVKVMKQVMDEMGANEITITFGQTELSPACTMTTTTDSIERRVSTVGKALPGVECKIINPETGEICPTNVPGEFCARGYNVMRGYYKMEEATRQTIDADGWVHSGDLCTCDEDGYYKVTGRIKDMIIRGGENIYPKEIEEFLYTVHDKVKDVQVIGVPSVKYGEEVMACIILKEGVAWTEDEAKKVVAANMAFHKVPSYVAFVESFPMNGAGKIMKYKMREWAVEFLGLQDAANIVTA